MRHPIHLNDHLRIRRIEIRHINPNRMLPPKLHPTRPQAQPLPQQNLRRRHLAPQPPRLPNRRLRSLPHPNLPPQSSLWRSHGEVAAAKRLTEGPSAQRSLRSPPLHHRLRRRSPSPSLRDREEIKTPNPPHPGPIPNKILPVPQAWGGGPPRSGGGGAECRVIFSFISQILPFAAGLIAREYLAPATKARRSSLPHNPLFYRALLL